ncbi:tyrosine-type recombinase/integrase [Actibacterium pelagium]|uniref:Phage integrase n=1 Tax=Actibacterium pelagium TaxID=2029103 RepID=A0A917ACJ4_9RHOB|nr:site-specific integrase [Actibacterium pelagium]GGE41423.1 phage integrase [Actibacterium pelagium]
MPNPNPNNKPLSVAFVNSVKAPGKYHDGKGTGLFLLVKPNGSRFWVQRLTIRGKRREIGLGSQQFTSLAEAREKALDNKRMALAGLDPIAEKRRAKRVLSFEEAARKTHIELSPTWKNPKDRAAFLSTLETYIFPRFGSVSLPDVTSADIRQAILAARERAPGVARKLVYRVSSVFRWGIAEGMCVSNPATTEALALPRETRTPNHRKALPYNDVPAFLKSLKASNAGVSTKLALELLILTATRSGEVRLADWSEIDLDEAEWTIPASRMKAKREHRIPLSPRAVEILLESKTLTGGKGLVFPGTKKGRPLSDMTLSKLVKELGYDVHVHGFRTSFKTWTQERTNTPREVSEAALAHSIKDKAEAAYARSDLFEKRRKLIERWGAQCANVASGTVAQIG